MFDRNFLCVKMIRVWVGNIIPPNLNRFFSKRSFSRRYIINCQRLLVLCFTKVVDHQTEHDLLINGNWYFYQIIGQGSPRRRNVNGIVNLRNKHCRSECRISFMFVTLLYLQQSCKSKVLWPFRNICTFSSFFLGNN